MSIVVNTRQTYTDTFVKGLAEGVYINETLDERNEIKQLFGLTEEEIYKVLAVSPITSRFKTLERKLHKMLKDKRVLKYEVFRNLNKDDIKVIMNELGNKINVVI